MALLVVWSSVASAEGQRSKPAQDGLAFALALNPPLRWGDAVAGSLYVGLASHHAIRANVAAYDHRTSPLLELVMATQGVGVESEDSGRTLDVSVGWQYFPRRLWSGFVLELGLLRRAQDHTHDEAFINNHIDRREAVGYAGRALVGWSWLFGEQVFVSVAVGLSVGHYTGTTTRTDTDDGGRPRGEPMSTTLSSDEVAAEGSVRIGIAFGS